MNPNNQIVPLDIDDDASLKTIDKNAFADELQTLFDWPELLGKIGDNQIVVKTLTQLKWNNFSGLFEIFLRDTYFKGLNHDRQVQMKNALTFFGENKHALPVKINDLMIQHAKLDDPLKQQQLLDFIELFADPLTTKVWLALILLEGHVPFKVNADPKRAFDILYHLYTNYNFLEWSATNKIYNTNYIHLCCWVAYVYYYIQNKKNLARKVIVFVCEKLLSKGKGKKSVYTTFVEMFRSGNQIVSECNGVLGTSFPSRPGSSIVMSKMKLLLHTTLATHFDDENSYYLLSNGYRSWMEQPDLQMSQTCLTKALELGHPLACFDMGCQMMTDRKCFDPQAGFELLSKRDRQNITRASEIVGLCHYYGLGTKVDLVAARKKFVRYQSPLSSYYIMTIDKVKHDRYIGYPTYKIDEEARALALYKEIENNYLGESKNMFTLNDYEQRLRTILFLGPFPSPNRFCNNYQSLCHTLLGNMSEKINMTTSIDHYEKAANLYHIPAIERLMEIQKSQPEKIANLVKQKSIVEKRSEWDRIKDLLFL